MNIGVVLTSRNNSGMLTEWHNANSYSGVDVLNIDEDSAPEEKEKLKNLCDKYNITYMDREERGMQNNILTACNYFEDRGIDWVCYFQHDAFTLEDDFFKRLDTYLASGKLDETGVIGFNFLNGPIELEKYNGEDTELFTIARCPLEPGDSWYRHKIRGHANGWTPPADKKTPFAVESVSWMAALVKISQYKKYIEPTGDYQFYHAWDDIAFQFLYNNVYNVVIPQFRLGHDQEKKVKYGLPLSSPTSTSKREHFYGKWGHHDVWKDRWGFEYDNDRCRPQFEQVKQNYENTLLMDFYNHNPKNGPLKSFPEWRSEG